MSASDKSPSREQSRRRLGIRPESDVLTIGYPAAPSSLRAAADAARKIFQSWWFLSERLETGLDLCTVVDVAALKLEAAEADRDRAVRALTRSGWTLVPGAAEWRPPLGADPRPLIEAVDSASSAYGILADALDVLGRHALGRRTPIVPATDGPAVGAAVSKIGGDYTFDGEVRGVILKRSGQARYVVEDDRGVLHIFSGKQLAPRGSARSA